MACTAANIAPVAPGVATDGSELLIGTPLSAGSAGRGLASYLFGKGGILNSNPYLRIGFGRFGGDRVFRLAGDLIQMLPESWQDNGHIILKNLGPLKRQ